MDTILLTENLSIGYRGKAIIDNINLRLKRRIVTAMIGRNGAGKSTLIKTLTKTLAPIGGEVRIKGERLIDISRRELSRLISVVTTDSNIAGGLRVRELIGMGRIPYTGMMGRLSKRDEEIVEQAIKTVGLSKKRESFIGELSDGERQKAMIGRGLVQDTPIIIMDEPFSFLDVATRLEMVALVAEIAAEEDKAILYSTHDVTTALRTAEAVWMFVNIDGEEKVEEGTPEKLVDAGYVDYLFPDACVIFDREKGEFSLKENHST